MANNGKLKLTDYNLTERSDEELDKIKKSIAKRQRRWDREHTKKKEDITPSIEKKETE